jgi:tRNA1Val (adenine37-N6)-methyltransferase
MNLNANETIEDLQLKGLQIIQNKKWFCFGMDAVLLSDFVEVKRNGQVVDLGTGTGIIPLLLWAKKSPAHIYGIEIQPEVADMALRSVSLNGLSDKIDILTMNLLDSPKKLGAHSMDVVTANPPYIENKGGLVNPEDKKALSRHEIACNLEDVVGTAAKLLKHQGRFYMVHRPHRLVDIISYMRAYKVEPKKMRMVYPKQGAAPNMVLIQGIKGGRPELKVEPPLIVYHPNNTYTDEIYRIYGMEKSNER